MTDSPLADNWLLLDLSDMPNLTDLLFRRCFYVLLWVKSGETEENET